MIPTARICLARSPWLLALLLALLLATRVQAQTDTLAVLESSATPAFPEQITFTLRAESSAAPITAVSLLYGMARGDSLTIVELAVAPQQQLDAQHVLDTRIFYIPPGVDLAYRWVIEDAAGNRTETEPQEIFYTDTRFDWQERTERNVTVAWYEGGDAFGDELMATTTRTLDRLRTELGAELSEPVRILIYASSEDMRAALRSNSVEWVGGQAFTGLGLIIGVVAPGNTSEVRRIVPHELSHQALHQVLDSPYGGTPLWFDEGLAVYNQETEDAIFPVMVEEAARSGRLIPLQALSSSFPADPERARLSYAQSHSVVAYISDTYGDAGIQALVDAFQEALPVDTALQEALGISVDELDAAWRSALPYPVAPNAPPPTADPLGSFAAPDDSFSTTPGQAQGNAQTSLGIQTGWSLWLALGIGLAGCVGVLGLLAGGVFLLWRTTRNA